jgi:hypothetical protein
MLLADASLLFNGAMFQLTSMNLKMLLKLKRSWLISPTGVYGEITIAGTLIPSWTPA